MTDIGDAYDILATGLGFSGSARMRAILEELMTPEQAQIASALPGSPQDVAQKLALSVDIVESGLDALFRMGCAFPRDFEKLDYYRFARSMGQFHDATKSAAERVEGKDRKFYQLWEDFGKNEFQ